MTVTQLRILSVGGVVLFALRAIFLEIEEQVPEKTAEAIEVGGPPASPSEVVTVAAVVLLLTVVITFSMPVVSEARSRFESEAGD